MKLVEVTCINCGHKQEVFVEKMVGFGEFLGKHEEVSCENCKTEAGQLKRLPNGSGIEYKTGGFYDTDYRGKTSR